MKVNYISVIVRQNLHFDVPRAYYCLLEKYVSIPKSTSSLAHRLTESIGQVGFCVNLAHSSATAAGNGLYK